MNPQNVNVKTATKESTERWVENLLATAIMTGSALMAKWEKWWSLFCQRWLKQNGREFSNALMKAGRRRRLKASNLVENALWTETSCWHFMQTALEQRR